MVVDTLAPLVDTQPAFNALVELKDQRDLYDDATKAFLRAKLERCVKDLRQTAKFIDDQLKEMQAPPA